MSQKTALMAWSMVAFAVALFADQAARGGGGIFFFTFVCLIGLGGAIAGPTLGPAPQRQHNDD